MHPYQWKESGKRVRKPTSSYLEAQNTKQSADKHCVFKKNHIFQNIPQLKIIKLQTFLWKNKQTFLWKNKNIWSDLPTKINLLS